MRRNTCFLGKRLCPPTCSFPVRRLRGNCQDTAIAISEKTRLKLEKKVNNASLEIFLSHNPCMRKPISEAKMPISPPVTIASLLVQHIPRDLIMGVEDALLTGARRGFGVGAEMKQGHRAHAVGQMRHFHMNETFRDALEAGGTNPTQIKGNRVVVGNAGIFALGRFNISNGVWNNGRRSRTRREMALANASIEPLVMPDLFESYKPTSKATVFFVGVFDRSVQDTMAIPMSIDVAVPDHELKGWLFRMSTTNFLAIYESQTVADAQPDLAMPLLKAGVIVAQDQKSGT